MERIRKVCKVYKVCKVHKVMDPTGAVYGRSAADEFTNLINFTNPLGCPSYRKQSAPQRSKDFSNFINFTNFTN